MTLWAFTASKTVSVYCGKKNIPGHFWDGKIEEKWYEFILRIRRSETAVARSGGNVGGVISSLKTLALSEIYVT